MSNLGWIYPQSQALPFFLDKMLDNMQLRIPEDPGLVLDQLRPPPGCKGLQLLASESDMCMIPLEVSMEQGQRGFVQTY